MTNWAQPIDGIERAPEEQLHYPWGVLRMYNGPPRAYSSQEIDKTMREVAAYEEMMRKQDRRRREAIRGFSREWFLTKMSESFSPVRLFWKSWRKYIRLATLFIFFDVGLAAGWYLGSHRAADLPPPPAPTRVSVYPIIEP